MHLMKAFVFTDIVASTQLKQALPGKTQADRDLQFIDLILEPHRRLIEHSLNENRGRMVKTLGDGCFVVFDSPVKAALWAMDVQVQHFEKPIILPNGETVGVKIGIHHGEASLDPQDPNDFSGRNVDYAARLVELATQGRIILSRSMYAQLEDAGIFGVSFHEHGERELRGIGRKTVYELIFGDVKPQPLKGDPEPEEEHSGPDGGGSGSDRQNVALAEKSRVVTSGSTIGNYVLGRRLGSGAMGTVYHAEHTGMAQAFAIKVIDEHLLSHSQENVVARFYREVKAVSRLNHRHIVRAHNASVRTDPVHYLVMEYLEGLSLDRAITSKSVHWAIAAEVIRQAAMGLSYIHDNELVHRDIKPSNLLVTYPRPGQDSEIKILDLGLALLLDEDERATRDQNSIMGSAYYMSPEQWQSSEVDIRADIYSLGCTFYHLLVGRAPFQDSPYNQKYAHQNLPVDEFPKSLEIPEPIWKITSQMLAKSPEERHTTPALLVEELEQISNVNNLSSWAHSFSDEATQSYIRTGVENETLEQTPSNMPKAVNLPGGESKRAASRFRANIETAIRTHPRLSVMTTIGLMAVIAFIWFTFRPSLVTDAATVSEFTVNPNYLATPAAVGDWWFDQTPWLTPGIRQTLATGLESSRPHAALRQSLPKLKQHLAEGSISEFLAELRDLRDEHLIHQTGDLEVKLAESLATLEKEQGKPLIDSLVNLERQLGESDSAEEIHLRAAIRHKLAEVVAAYCAGPDAAEKRAEIESYLQDHSRGAELKTPLDYQELASADYQLAIESYDDGDRLTALAYSDIARLHMDMRNKRLAVYALTMALEVDEIEEAHLVRASLLCSLANVYRKYGRAASSVEQLVEANEALEQCSFIDAGSSNHPMLAAVEERMGWAKFELWSMDQSQQHFNEYLSRLDSWSEREDANWRDDLTVLHSHAEMGQLMVWHYLGRQDDAVRDYRQLIDQLTSANNRRLTRRTLNLLDRLADAQMFGPQPDYVGAVETFDTYSGLERTTTIPPDPLRFKNYRMCIAIAMSGDVNQAKKLLSSIDGSGVDRDARQLTASVIAEFLCSDERNVDRLVDNLTEVVSDLFGDGVKPHPHLAQLLFFSTELIADESGLSSDADVAETSARALVDLVDELQTDEGKLNTYFRRYLIKAREGLVSSGAESNSSTQLIEYIDTLLAQEPL